MMVIILHISSVTNILLNAHISNFFILHLSKTMLSLFFIADFILLYIVALLIKPSKFNFYHFNGYETFRKKKEIVLELKSILLHYYIQNIRKYKQKPRMLKCTTFLFINNLM